MALSLKKLGIEFGIDADDEKSNGGVKIGDIKGDVSGDIAGRDIHKNSNFYKSIQAAMNAAKGSNETMLVHANILKSIFPILLKDIGLQVWLAGQSRLNQLDFYNHRPINWLEMPLY